MTRASRQIVFTARPIDLDGLGRRAALKAVKSGRARTTQVHLDLARCPESDDVYAVVPGTGTGTHYTSDFGRAAWTATALPADGHAVPDAERTVFDGVRTDHPLQTPNAEAVLSVYRGKAKAPGASRAKTVAEAHLYLTAGAECVLPVLARDLAGGLPLVLAPQPFAGLGVDPRRLARAKKGDVILEPGMTVAEAARIIGRECLDHALSNHRPLAENADPEAVHQMRVAMRRLRSALRLFKGVLATEGGARAKADIQALARRLGPARDLDVFLREVLTPAVAALPPDPALDDLAAHFEAARDAALKRAVSTARSARFGRLMLDLSAWIEAGDWLAPDDDDAARALAEPITAFAHRSLDKAARKVFKTGGPSIKKISDAERHATRIAIKRFRYAGQFFAALGPTKKTARMLQLLSDAQDGLGALNDVAVASEILSAHLAGAHGADGARAAGMVVGRLAVSKAEQLNAAAKTWKALRRAKPFWTKM